MATVKEISAFINKIAPYSTQCEWDNCGILVGSKEKQVNKIGFALDLTSETLNSAKENAVDLIITHHPVIFKAQKSFLQGNIAYDAAVSGISVISAHTCFDCAVGGVNDVLCEVLGISDVQGVPTKDCEVPMVRMGNVQKISSRNFAKLVAEKLGTVCRVVNCENEIEKVAVCGGAGMDFYLEAVSFGADCYVTGDISHHEMLLAKETGVTVVAAGHFETEVISMKALQAFIKNEFSNLETVLLDQSNPIEFIG